MPKKDRKFLYGLITGILCGTVITLVTLLNITIGNRAIAISAKDTNPIIFNLSQKD